MRTTVSLAPDVRALIEQMMRERGVTLTQAVNDAIRAGLAGPAERRPFRTPTYDMGEPLIPLDKAHRIAAELEEKSGSSRQ